MSLAGKKIIVGVGGGIAAFKSVELTRALMLRGCEVRVAMTPAAVHFVGPTTFAAITGKLPATDLFDPGYAGEVHVELSEWANAIVVAPATADLMARAGSGMANDVLLATLLCADCPVYYAPAMHERMWLSASTQRTVKRLRADGATLIGPVRGLLANGREGMGRMEEPAGIVDVLERDTGSAHDLAGKTILVTAGPTVEDIDPVRFISNRSSGRMGYAVARRARERGARVVLVSGPVNIDPPDDVRVVRVRSAMEMRGAVGKHRRGADVIVMTAAVADYRPATPSKRKVKKKADTMSVGLVRNPDILGELGQARKGKRPVLVGFAMETDDLVAYARRKLKEKKADLIVANKASVGFGGDDNQATLIGPRLEDPLPRMSKLDLADRILDRVKILLAKR
jgi:phosphopantothenoylcysteine decarboxylase/phosphopantothenate--cysteine ligase